MASTIAKISAERGNPGGRPENPIIVDPQIMMDFIASTDDLLKETEAVARLHRRYAANLERRARVLSSARAATIQSIAQHGTTSRRRSAA